MDLTERQIYEEWRELELKKRSIARNVLERIVPDLRSFKRHTGIRRLVRLRANPTSSGSAMP